MSNELPVGTIITYAGEDNTARRGELKNQGWLFCDGETLSREDRE